MFTSFLISNIFLAVEKLQRDYERHIAEMKLNLTKQKLACQHKTTKHM